MKTELMERPKGVNISSMSEFTPPSKQYVLYLFAQG